MPKSNAALLAATGLLLLLIGTQLAAAANPPGVSLSLTLPFGRTRFHRGEVITLMAAFASSSPSLYRLNTDDGSRDLFWNTDTFFAEPASGGMDPLRTYYAHEFGEAYSGGGPQFRPLTSQPITIPFTLNEWLRFDAPGRYRVFLTSRRVVDAGKNDQDRLRFQGRTTVSNTVDFEILPDDPTWNARTLRQALPLFNADGFDYNTYVPRKEASRTLRFLDTPEAAQAMVARYGHNDDSLWYSPSYRQIRLGLYGSLHFEQVVREMKRRIADPEFPVFIVLLDDLAQTQYLAAYPQPVPQPALYDPVADKERRAAIGLRRDALNALKEEDCKLLASALPTKRGKARAVSTYALLMADYPALDKDVHWKLLQALVPVFDDLTIQEKNNLLDNPDWVRAGGAGILPLLRRVYASPPQKVEPGPTRAEDQKQTYSLALRRLRELSPGEGRSLLLAQIAGPHPRVDVPTLLSLPDPSLPALDTVLASLLENGMERRDGDWDNLPLLVERYATAAILTRMKAAFADKRGGWAGAQQFNMLAYFLRTDRPYGIQQCRIALAARKTNFWYRSLLSDVAALSPCPELAVLSREYLNDPDPEVASDAAKTLRLLEKVPSTGG